MTNDNDEWGNLGGFDANDNLAAVRAANKRIHNERKHNPVKAKIWKNAQQKNLKQRWQDPDYVKTMNDARIRITQDPKRNAKISASRKKYWQDENNRKTAAKKSKARWEDPDYVESVIASQRLAVVTPFGEYISQAEFGRQTKLVFKDKQREMPHLYYNLVDGPGEATFEKVCVTPMGEFKNKRCAFDAHKDNLYTPKPTTQKGKPWSYQIWWKWVTKNLCEQFYTKEMIRREWLL